MRLTVSPNAFVWDPTRGWSFRRLLLLAIGLVGLAAAALLALSGAISTAPPAAPEQPVQAGVSQQVMAQSLTRTGIRPEGDLPEVSVMLLTREFVASSENQQLLGTIGEPSVLFYLYEEAHVELPAQPPEPLLRLVGAGLDGTSQRPAEIRLLTDSFHHRAMVIRYPLTGPLGHLEHGMGERLELVLPAATGVEDARNVLSWALPVRYGESGALGNPVMRGSTDLATAAPAAQGSTLSLAVVLGMFAGFLASMWPCLFQLTVYFIPSLAGLTLGQAKVAPAVARQQVLKTALFFVLGIVIVYTAAGGIVGFAAQSFSGAELYQTWQRPLSLVAALVMVVMAIRVAAQARAPLVCKMPVLGHLGKRPTGPVGTMVLGLTFATGCMTCFGSALVLGLLMYTISSASALTGALLLFFFSLGISVPLVAAAIVMSRLLPLLERLQSVARWMALASSATMIAFAALLVSGQYHALSGAIARLTVGG